MTDHLHDWQHDLEVLRKREGLETAVNLRPTNVDKIRLSPQVQDFLTEKGESAKDLLTLPTVVTKQTPDNYPLTHYYISSSHNTYLLSRQILGHASALTYTHVLMHHARCIEIDVWPGSNGPIVTHGYTLSSYVPFIEVCEAIGMAVNEGDWPVLLSLECHVPPEGQKELVRIMEQCWGEKLIKKEVAPEAKDVTPAELRGRIVAMIEYYPPKDPTQSQTPEEEEEEEEVESDGGTVRKVKHPPSSTISDALAALGVYARSMKPSKGWLTEHITEPAHILINISESTISALLPASLNQLIENSLLHLRRVYPRGTRITSSNLNPSKYWGDGSQIAALNWQNYDRGVQINEAMFVGTPGWVLKPPHLLPQTGTKMRLRRKRIVCHVAGLSSMPVPLGSSSLPSYLIVQLLHPGIKAVEQSWRSKTVKSECTTTYDPSLVSTSPDENPEKTVMDVWWDETFDFDYDEEELEFVRFSVWQDVSFAPDVRHLVFVARIDYLEQGWRMVRMLTMKGKDSGATLAVKFEVKELFTI